MFAYEIELDLVQPFIAVPQFEQFKNKHVRVLFIAEDAQDQTHVTMAKSLPLVYDSPAQVSDFSLAGNRDSWHER